MLGAVPVMVVGLVVVVVVCVGGVTVTGMSMNASEVCPDHHIDRI